MLRARWVLLALVWGACDDAGAPAAGDAGAVAGDASVSRADARAHGDPDAEATVSDAAPPTDAVRPRDGALAPVDGASPPDAGGSPPTPDALPPAPDAAPADPCLERVVRVGDVEVFVYEASRLDADAEGAGADDGRACSRRGVLPWIDLTAADAQAACEASGFGLCSFETWSQVCAGHGPDGPRLFPYGYAHQPGACNEHISGSGAVEPTGGRPGCVTPEGVYDLSGNVWELVSEGEKCGASWKLNAATFRVDAARCDAHYVVPGAFFAEDLGFRCCRAAR